MIYAGAVLTSTLHAIVLGIVQGLAEFIPISSSGHLVLIPTFFGIERGGLSFDVALHLGTMLAVIVYLRRELTAILLALVGRRRDPAALVYRKLGLFAVIGSIPVGIVGFALLDLFEDVFATPVIAAVSLLITGTLLMLGERMRDRRVERALQRTPAGVAASEPESASGAHPGGPRGGAGTATSEEPHAQQLALGRDASDPAGIDLSRMSLREAVLVGLAQCIALFPGISRSGTTIVAGMASGLTREAATRFSFLLSLPALAGATLVSVPDLTDGTNVYPPLAILAGVIAAFVAGYLAIGFLIKLVARDRLTGFALYCFAAGVLSLFVLLAL